MESQPGPRIRSLTQSLLQYRGMLYGFIYSMVRDVLVAEEIFQEVAVVAIEKERKGDEVIREPAQWLKEVARRLVHAGFRTRQGRVVAVDPSYLEQVAQVDSETSLEQHRARLAALDGCLEKVSGLNRDLLTRRYVLGNTFEDIGKETQRTPGSLRVMVHRIERRLADCLQQRLAGSHGS